MTGQPIPAEAINAAFQTLKSFTPVFDVPDRMAEERVRRALEAAAPALRAQGAEAERERITALFGEWIPGALHVPGGALVETWKAAFASLTGPGHPGKIATEEAAGE